MKREDEPASSWAKRRDRVSRRIELAALRLCLDRGVDAVTVEEIAQAAGISRRTFYRYFETIDDVLNASPRRSLDRICEGVRRRPLSENIWQAWVNGAHDLGPSAEEREVQGLAFQIARRDPVAWWRALARIQPSADEVFEALVAERLLAAGEDASLASLIAKALNAAMTYTARTAAARDGPFSSTADDLEAAIHKLVEVVGSAKLDPR